MNTQSAGRDCDMCRDDFFTSTPATTTRTHPKTGRTVYLCEECATLEWDAIPFETESPTEATCQS